MSIHVPLAIYLVMLMYILFKLDKDSFIQGEDYIHMGNFNPAETHA